MFKHPVAQPLGFSEVILPGALVGSEVFLHDANSIVLALCALIPLPDMVRNDLYITLKKAEIERGKKTTQRNLEVVMVVTKWDGTEV